MLQTELYIKPFHHKFWRKLKYILFKECYRNLLQMFYCGIYGNQAHIYEETQQHIIYCSCYNWKFIKICHRSLQLFAVWDGNFPFLGTFCKISAARSIQVRLGQKLARQDRIRILKATQSQYERKYLLLLLVEQIYGIVAYMQLELAGHV